MKREDVFVAIQRGDLESVKSWLDEGGDVELYSKEGVTPLMEACFRGNLPMVELLIDRGASVNQTCRTVPPPVSHPGVVSLPEGEEMIEQMAGMTDFLSESQTKSQEFIGQTPLMFAVEGGNSEVVTALLDRGAEVTTTDRDHISALVLAVVARRSDIVEILLEKGADVNEEGHMGTRPLFVAVETGDVSMVRQLLERGAEPDVGGPMGISPLSGAVKQGSLEIVEILLAGGASAQTSSLTGTAHFIAVEQGEKDILKLLLDHGARADDIGVAGQTLVMLAIQEGHQSLVPLLLNYGASIEPRDMKGKTALHWAATVGEVAVAEILLARGESVNVPVRPVKRSIIPQKFEGWTPLFFAAQAGHRKMVQFLLDQVADPYHRPPTGGTLYEVRSDEVADLLPPSPFDRGYSAWDSGEQAFIDAIEGEEVSIHWRDQAGRSLVHEVAGRDWNRAFEVLASRGVPLDSIDHWEMTPLMEVESKSLAQALLDSGADIDMSDERGDTALFHAIAGKDWDIVEVLVDRGASLTHENSRGEIPLELVISQRAEEWIDVVWPEKLEREKLDSILLRATEEGALSVVARALEEGAGPNPDLLLIPAREGYREIAKLLLDRGLSLEVCDDEGWTPLMMAVAGDHLDLVQLFIEGGVDLDRTDTLGRTSLMIASGTGRESIARALLDGGCSLDITDDKGRTAGEIGKSRNHLGIVKMIEERKV